MSELLKLLNKEFETKKQKNSNYSLRSLAKNLDVQPGSLSHVLNGKRKISKRLRVKIYGFLGLTEEEVYTFEELEKEKNRNFISLKKSYLDTISDWHFDAILELMRTKDFTPDVNQVAKRLGIDSGVVKEAINKLVEIERIVVTEDGQWIDMIGDSLIYDDVDSSEALLNLQLKIIGKATESLQTVPKAYREQASMCMAVSSKDLPWVMNKIKKFQQEVCEHLQKHEQNSDQVYQLMTCFFPLSEIHDKDDSLK